MLPFIFYNASLYLADGRLVNSINQAEFTSTLCLSANKSKKGVNKMNLEEIYKSLKEFGNYLDKMKPSYNKGKLTKYYIANIKCYDEYIKYKYLYERLKNER